MGLRVNYGRIITKFNGVISSQIKQIFAKSYLIPCLVSAFMLFFVTKLSIFLGGGSTFWFIALVLLSRFCWISIPNCLGNWAQSLFISFELFESERVFNRRTDRRTWLNRLRITQGPRIYILYGVLDQYCRNYKWNDKLIYTLFHLRWRV